MDFKYPTSKKLYLVVEISQLLSKYNCTFSEAESILSLSLSEIRQQRENLEYDTTLDYINSNKQKLLIMKKLSHHNILSHIVNGD